VRTAFVVVGGSNLALLVGLWSPCAQLLARPSAVWNMIMSWRAALTSFCISIASIIGTIPAGAQASALHVDTAGDDAKDCSSASPCKALARACQLVSATIGWRGDINLAPGTYPGGCTLTYSNVVTVMGDCSHPDRVVIELAGGDIAFFVQDHAIVGINCLTILSTGTGSIGIETRQYAIADYNKVRFGPFPGGKHVAAQEASKINCISTDIIGGADHHAVAGWQSQIVIGQVAIPSPVAFLSFALATTQSLINGSGASFAGEGVSGTTGLQYISQDSLVIAPPSGFPGQGVRIDALPQP